MKIFSIYDAKAQAYIQPFFSPTNGTAIRSFQSACNETNSNFNRYAADYTLFEIGEWEEQHGNITPHDLKKSLGTALEYITILNNTPSHQTGETEENTNDKQQTNPNNKNNITTIR
jgi:hypothetical protein